MRASKVLSKGVGAKKCLQISYLNALKAFLLAPDSQKSKSRPAVSLCVLRSKWLEALSSAKQFLRSPPSKLPAQGCRNLLGRAFVTHAREI